MTFDPVFPAQRREKLRAAGFWGDDLIVDLFDEVAEARADAVAVVDRNSETGAVHSLTFGELRDLSDRAAAGLLELGIGPGDVVAVQLPNWWHYFALYPACARIGAVINPLMPIFREHELKFMLHLPRTKLIVIPEEFRGHNFPAMIDRLRPSLPDLKHVLVAEAVNEKDCIKKALFNRPPVAPGRIKRPHADDVTELMYTSGTTGEPKGVMHTANTLLSKARLATQLFQLTHADAIFMGSPMAHQTGFMYGGVLSLVNGIKCVLQDIWDPIVAARNIQDEHCTLTLASTPFLSDLVYTPAVREYDIDSLRLFLCAGAPIPRALLRDAAAALPSCYVMSAWGMTENGIVTATYPGDPEEKVFDTDGRALPHQEVRVVNDANQELPAHEEGRLQARGPTTFVGYYKARHPHGLDDALWMETGDLARMDQDGYVRITGRSKDIIIRGGENIPVMEIEQLLYRHPAVLDVAVIGTPDARLGERGCAIVQLHEGHSFNFDTMIAFLEEHQLTKSYLPERLMIVDTFPRTPSGKIQKFKLRQMFAAGNEND